MINQFTGERMSLGHVVVALISQFSSALSEFTWRSRVTPALRERCIDYALRQGQRGSHQVIREAEDLVEYIAKGKS